MSQPSPAIQQYMDLKAQHPEHLLLFQMGDFYEMFFEDAVIASQILDIALTKRGHYQGADIPMCGVPLHASHAYLNRLIAQGFSVALCEQIETPLTKTGKGPLKRAIVRIMTPGTLTEETLLEPKSPHFIGCLIRRPTPAPLWGIALIELSTGDFLTEVCYGSLLESPLLNWGPRELLLPESLMQLPDVQKLRQNLTCVLTPLPGSRFDPANGKHRLETFFKVSTLEAFGTFHEAERTAAGSLLDYVVLTQKQANPSFSHPRQIQAGEFVKLDPFTRRNLELTHTLDGQKKGSLFSLLDQTVTPGGGRLLTLFLQNPLHNVARIQKRLEAVDFFYQAPDLGQEIRGLLKACPDVERPLTRLLLGRGGPKDLGMVRDVVRLIPALQKVLAECHPLPELLQKVFDGLALEVDRYEPLCRGLRDVEQLALPLLTKEGGFVADGYHTDLDMWRSLCCETDTFLANLEERYRAETQISTLKVRENNLIGLYVEVSQGQLHKVPDSFTFKQKLTQGARYTTPELLDLQTKRREALGCALEQELEIFRGWVTHLDETQEALRRVAKSLAALDVYAALAHLARDQGYVKPEVNETARLSIVEGFHPVVRSYLSKEGGETFVPNTCILKEQAFAWLLTGPNMAGKSTFLRQNALIVLMAQMGSFVPAVSAEIGICDRIFSRVGASDNLARGESTFMVEMVETATILNQATAQSFVILDELGRGTSTHDGLALAWACFEWLVLKQRCRTLFATHYHELTVLEERLPGVACYTPQITEWGGDIVFMHKVIPGKAESSYGLHVAKLAGVPAAVLARAQEIQETVLGQQPPLAQNALGENSPAQKALLGGDGPSGPSVAKPFPSPAEAYVLGLDLPHVSPQEALNILYSLQEQLREQPAQIDRTL